MTTISERVPRDEPALTVAVPAYGNAAYLRICLESLVTQTSSDFEIFVSDDCSPEDVTETLTRHLEESSAPFQVHRQPRNLGYDGNVRFCLTHARGRHVFLLGQDDALVEPDDVLEVIRTLDELGRPEVAFTNFQDWATGSPTARAASTALVGSGMHAALSHFRSFSFVSGLLFERRAVLEHDTSKWDGSIYIQVYLACRILAAGGRLGAINRCCVRKDILVGDRGVETYATQLQASEKSIAPRATGLDMVVRVTVDAVEPYLERGSRTATLRRVAAEVLAFQYLYWLLEYRRIGGLVAGIGVARSMTPKRLLGGRAVPFLDRMALLVLYSSVTAVGLALPARAGLALSKQGAAALRRQRQRGRR